MTKMGRVLIEFTDKEVKSAMSKQVCGKKMYKLWYQMEVDVRNPF